jgi:hypothetical protein
MIVKGTYHYVNCVLALIFHEDNTINHHATNLIKLNEYRCRQRTQIWYSNVNLRFSIRVIHIFKLYGSSYKLQFEEKAHQSFSWIIILTIPVQQSTLIINTINFITVHRDSKKCKWKIYRPPPIKNKFYAGFFATVI